ncbi:MAG: ATP-dependent DNA helicase RecG [Patescibacteria group bacterium]
MLNWDDPVSFLHGLTPQQRRVLKSLEAENVSDLISILPRRYDDFSRITSIANIPIGLPVTVKVTIKDIKKLPTFRRRFAIIRALVSDESGTITATWFNQPWLLSQFKAGDRVYLSGVVTERPRFGRGFTSPICEPITPETLAAGSVAPVYPLTGSITQKTLRKIMKSVLEEVEWPPDFVSQDILEKVHAVDLASAYKFVHRPSNLEQAEEGRRRLAFNELLLYQLALRLARTEADAHGAPKVEFDIQFAKKFVSSLPFELTDDQKKCVWAAVKDMESARPMRRLLQGDVGSGKTAVAIMLNALVFRSGHSAVLMAPTDLLAKQHAATFNRFLSNYHIPVLLMTSSRRSIFESGEERILTASEARERIIEGRLVAVGTHALIEHGQSPPDLALAIVDEQHRFGVAERETLIVSSRSDGLVPHLLSMTATPIPRSLALTMYGDLDVSLIRMRPAGRKKVITKIFEGDAGREEAYAMIREQVSKNHRAFIVCPLIDPSDALGARSVTSELKRLETGALKGLRLASVHGKLTAKEKDEAMTKFVQGELDVLIATTVVEVGVDVPEATVMLIEGAERFGLAQLHQLRGRVGRSIHQSHCLLVASDSVNNVERLRILEQTDDGFAVAEADLKNRGQGNLLGFEQSGEAIFKAARLDDLSLMASAREISEELLNTDPLLKNHRELKEKIEKLRETTHRE